MKDKAFGILMPIFSLPSEYGIGDFGKESYKFIDNLKKSGAKIWQILPLVQTGLGNSPYSSIAFDSINPYFISPEILLKKGLITRQEAKLVRVSDKLVNYSKISSLRLSLLEKAFSRFDKENADFKKFIKSKKAYDYALFMSLKDFTEQKSFYQWQDEYKYRNEKALKSFAKENKAKILFWQFVQYEALCEWQALKDYANKNGISVMGDMPLYVALDSVDVWKNPTLFKLNSDFSPKKVAGVPPDYFCADGQLWGNPVYDYKAHEAENFTWWTNRIKSMLSIYDYVRIDHFRALDRYYEIESSATNARVGEWVKVPSDKLFKAIHKKVNKNKIIAEDLGIIDDGVRELLKKVGYPGMKVLSFAFNNDPNNLHLPQNIEYNSICYTGTHDNDTLRGLIENASNWDYNNIVRGVKESLETMGVKERIDGTNSLIDSIVSLGMKSSAKWFILPMQDVLKLDGSYRVNEPGTIKAENWSVRFSKEQLKASVFTKLKTLATKYNRC